MHRKSLFIGLFLVSAVCLAQAPIPGAAKQQIADHTMLIEDRGSKVEVIASKRVVADKGRNGGKPACGGHDDQVREDRRPAFGRRVQSLDQCTGLHHRAHCVPDERRPAAERGLDPSDYPGLKKLTDPDVYVVVANTPGEFVALVQRLQARTDLRWVEPIIEYGEVAPNISDDRLAK